MKCAKKSWFYEIFSIVILGRGFSIVLWTREGLKNTSYFERLFYFGRWKIKRWFEMSEFNIGVVAGQIKKKYKKHTKEAGQALNRRIN